MADISLSAFGSYNIYIYKQPETAGQLFLPLWHFGWNPFTAGRICVGIVLPEKHVVEIYPHLHSGC